MPGDTKPKPEPSHPARRRRRRRSPHPLPPAARPGVLAFVWIALLVYGSLLPFDLNPAPHFVEAGGLWPGLSTWLAGPGWVSAATYGGPSALGFSLSAVDLAVNLALYVPLGVMLRIAMRRRGLHWTLQIVSASLILFGLSWLMECAQMWSHNRVGSLWDVVANTGTGVAAVLVAPLIWSAVQWVMVCANRRLSGPVHMVRVRLRFLQRSPGVLMALSLPNAVLLTGLYLILVARAFGGPAAAQAGVALPFERHFAYSYDTAAVLLGRSLLIYASVGCLLSLAMLRNRAKLPLCRVVVGVLGVALGIELYRGVARPEAFRADITELLIAVGAGLLIVITSYLFLHAVRRANRRLQQSDFEGPDRRRMRYEYGEPE